MESDSTTHFVWKSYMRVKAFERKNNRHNWVMYKIWVNARNQSLSTIPTSHKRTFVNPNPIIDYRTEGKLFIRGRQTPEGESVAKPGTLLLIVRSIMCKSDIQRKFVVTCPIPFCCFSLFLSAEIVRGQKQPWGWIRTEALSHTSIISYSVNFANIWYGTTPLQWKSNQFYRDFVQLMPRFFSVAIIIPTYLN